MTDDLNAAVAENYPVRLAELKALDGAEEGTVGMGIGYALVEYIIDTYGKQTLVPMLQAMDASSTFEEVIPAVFGVSAGEFEVAWNAWLAAHYGLEATTLPAIYRTDPASQITVPGHHAAVNGEVTITGTARIVLLARSSDTTL